MRIKTLHYEFKRVYNEVYTIKNLASSNIKYDIDEIRNNEKVHVVLTTTVKPLEISTLNLPKEAIYLISITHQDILLKEIEIRHFPTLKENIIVTMQDVICNCDDIEGTLGECGTGGRSPMAQDTYNMQMLYNSVGLYLDLLMSPQFLRHYDAAVIQLFTDKSALFIGLLQKLYNNVNNYGKADNSMHLVRLYTAYMYAIYYVMEIDISKYTSDSTSQFGTQPLPLVSKSTSYITEINAINELFGLDSMTDCFSDICVDIYGLIERFRKLYLCDVMGIYPCPGSPGPDPDPDPETAKILNLSYTQGDKGYMRYVEVGYELHPEVFIWDVIGIPEHLELSDSIGQLVKVSVDGTSYDAGYGVQYVKHNEQDVVWTLDGSNVSPITTITSWIYPAYVGKEVALGGNVLVPSADVILGGEKRLGNFKNGISYYPQTANDEYMWFAVPVTAAPVYNWWKSSSNPLNKERIGGAPGSHIYFMSAHVVVVNSIQYNVYVQNDYGPVDGTITVFSDNIID